MPSITYLHKHEETIKYKGSDSQYSSKRKVKIVTKVYIKRSNNRARGKFNWGTLVTLATAVLQIAAKLMGSDERRTNTAFIGIIFIMKIDKQSVTSLEDIANIIGFPVGAIEYFSNNLSKHVKEYQIAKKNRPSEYRTISEPSKELMSILRAINKLILGEYVYPSFVYGVGLKTLKDHAEFHKGDKEIIQVDLKDFYPTLSHKLVYVMWTQKFGFNPHAARTLTKLTTMDGGLKQGFPTSSHIAAIVAEPFTIELDKFCAMNGLRFSEYVDDLNISSGKIDKRLVFKTIVPLARKIGLTIKKSKTNVVASGEGRVITGVSLYGQRTRATKEVRQKAIAAMKTLRTRPDDETALKRVNGYLGFLRHLRRSDGRKYRKMKMQNLANKKQ